MGLFFRSTVPGLTVWSQFDDVFAKPRFWPLELGWSGVWFPNYAGAPWVGEPSTGPSGGRNLVSVDPLRDPYLGLPLNGYTPAAFDGGDDVLKTANPGEDFVGTTTCTIMAVVKVNSAPAPTTYVWDDPCVVVTENSATVALGISSSGVAFGIYTNGGGVQTSYVPLAPGWHVIQARMDGTDARVRVDGGAWATVAAADIASGGGNVFVVGSDLTAAAQAFDGEMELLAIHRAALDIPMLDALNSWGLVLFGLVASQTVASKGFVWRALWLGTSSLTIGARTVASSGRVERSPLGASSATPGPLALASAGRQDRAPSGISSVAPAIAVVGRGLTERTRVGTSGLSRSVSVAAFGQADRLFGGVSALASGVVSLATTGLQDRAARGTSALAATIAIASLGRTERARSGPSALAIGGVTLAGFGARPRDVAGSSAISTATLIAMASLGLVERLRAGVSTLSPAGVALSSIGRVDRARGGVSQVSTAALVSSFGLVGRERIGTSSSTTAVALASTGARERYRSGASGLAPGGVFVTGFGASPRDVMGVSSLSTFVTFQITSVGYRPRAVFGTSGMAVGGVSLGSVGQPVHLVSGVSGVSLGARVVAGVGYRASSPAGTSTLGASAAITTVGARASRGEGVSALGVSLDLVSFGSVDSERAGESAFAVSPVVLASLGLAKVGPVGVSGLGGGMTIAAASLVERLRVGTSFLTALVPTSPPSRGEGGVRFVAKVGGVVVLTPSGNVRIRSGSGGGLR